MNLSNFLICNEGVAGVVWFYSVGVAVPAQWCHNTSPFASVTYPSTSFMTFFDHTVKILITHTFFVGWVVVSTWVVCELSKGYPYVGYQRFSDGLSVGHWCVITRPLTTWPTHDPQASFLHLDYYIINSGL